MERLPFALITADTNPGCVSVILVSANPLCLEGKSYDDTARRLGKKKAQSAGPLSSAQRESCLLFLNTTRFQGEAGCDDDDNTQNPLRLPNRVCANKSNLPSLDTDSPL